VTSPQAASGLSGSEKRIEPQERPIRRATLPHHSSSICTELSSFCRLHSDCGDDEAALAYGVRFKGEVLDVAGDNYAGHPQVEKALERIRTDRAIAAAFPAAATTSVSFGNSLNRPTKSAFARSW
jgi:hypothetical protein